MAFDNPTPEEMTPRDRMVTLRNFLADLPDHQFDMGMLMNEAGDCPRGCVAGWTLHLFDPALLRRGANYHMWNDDDLGGGGRAVKILGLQPEEAQELFLPVGFLWLGFTRMGAVATIDRFLATGEMSWSPPEAPKSPALRRLLSAVDG